ncbi:uncharacterized protein LOC100902484 [Galendromus occidentalis]|uniref:Uncharacterized protein LOC100902484 n=1 Tax=Galendromus occidentalis TaxID=34638 RepID=A0AAJ6VVV5_9ACAR|nr:uncharacterized protein LOC100902484 [Galendromus occidentalis]
MCSLLEPYATLAVAGEMKSAGGPLFSAGPSLDTVLASVSPSSVALLKLEDSRPSRYWFTKPTTPFTTTAVWDATAGKIVSASHGKVLAWTNSEKATPAPVAECPSDVLSLLPLETGLVVVCRNGLAFRLHYDRPNWSVQIPSSIKGNYSWAGSLNEGDVAVLSEDCKSVVRFPVDDAPSRVVVKTPAKFTIAACCIHEGTLFAANIQGKLLKMRDGNFTPTKIDLKMEKNHLTAILSCQENLLIASETMVSLWDANFGLVKNTLKISFTPWTNKCVVLNNRALFASSSLMVLPIKIQKFSLAGLVGSKKKSEKKTPICVDVCESVAANVSSWSVDDVQKIMHDIDDLSEQLIVRCWKRLLELGDPTQNSRPLYKLIISRHNCEELTPVLHEYLSLEEVQKSIDFVACCMADLSLAQVSRGLLESLMDWACHLVDAHRNALKVSLRADNDASETCLLKLNQSVLRVQLLTDDLQSCQHNIKVFLGKTDKVVAPREKLYWVEPFDFFNKS